MTQRDYSNESYGCYCYCSCSFSDLRALQLSDARSAGRPIAEYQLKFAAETSLPLARVTLADLNSFLSILINSC